MSNNMSWGQAYSEIVELLEASGFWFVQDRGFSGDSFFMEVEYDGEYRTYRLYIRYSNDEGRAWGSQGISIRSQDAMRFVNAIDRVVSTKIVQGGDTSNRKRGGESIRERRDRYREQEEEKEEKDTSIRVPRVSKESVSETSAEEAVEEPTKKPSKKQDKQEKTQEAVPSNEQIEDEQIKDDQITEKDVVAGEEVDKDIHEVPEFDAEAIKEESRKAAKSIEDPELREKLLKKLDEEA